MIRGDRLRRLVGGAVLLVASALLLPKAWGFVSATVGLRQSSTWYPAVSGTQADVISCWQSMDPVEMQMDDVTNYSGSYFKCKNNWVGPVTVTITVLNGNGTGLVLTGHTGTLAAGATACIPGTNMRATTRFDPPAVSYLATIDQADLYASVAFDGNVRVQNNRNPTVCS
jgi:hypothetical protein